MRPGDGPNLQYVQQRPWSSEHLERHVPNPVQQQRQRQRVVLDLPRSAQPPGLFALLGGAVAVQLLAGRPAETLQELEQRW